MEKTKSNWHERIRMFTIVASFILGWGITAWGFISPPQGEIDNSVVVIFGQALCYTATGLGIKDYVDIQTYKYRGTNSSNEEGCV